jgi:peroxiredoxin
MNQRIIPVIFAFALSLLTLHTSGQNVIDGTISGLSMSRVYLLSIYGERARAIDSTMADQVGHFRIVLGNNRLPGMYRVKWSKEGEVELIWNHEDVVFTTDDRAPADSLRILKSLENRLLQVYSAIDGRNQTKLQLLMPIVDLYPETDEFYHRAVAEFEHIQKAQKHYLDSISARYPTSYAVRMARISQPPFISASMSKEERLTFLKQHYFDQVDFNDTSLLRSMVFVNKAVSYLSLYSNNRLQQKQLEAEFIKAVTIMLGAASVNSDTYKFLLDYLVGGFDKYHFDDVITYIADNFQDPGSCEDQERKSALQKKLDNFKKLSIGKTAPELEVNDPSGKPVKLSSVTAEYTLVVFWASTCPHCVSMTPRLKELYDRQEKKLWEVYSVSIDTSKTAWTSFLAEEKLTWINVSDLKSYYGKSAEDYNIYATPTMFLLDREKKILAKPISLMETEQALRDHNLIR